MASKANTFFLTALTFTFFFSFFSSQAATTFVLTTSTYEGGSVIDFLTSTTGTPDDGAPYTIIIPEDVEFEIKSVAFDLTTLSGDVTVTIEGENENGGVLKFKKNGAMIVINTGDVITVDPGNEEGLHSEDSHGQVKVDTDGASYTGHGLEAVVDAGGVQCDGTLGAPLPVEWMEFKVELVGKTVRVNWTTATEKNNDYFVVEYSIDGIRFDALGEVQGTGTTSDSQSYSFVHENPATGANYYRVRQVDYDGNTSLTSMQVLQIEGRTESFSVSVASGQLSLQVNEDLQSNMAVL